MSVNLILQRSMPALKGLDRLPAEKEQHYWADYIELLCLVHPDGLVTKGDVLDRIGEREDLGGEVDEIEGDFAEEAGVTLEDLGEDKWSAEIDDKWAAEADSWFAHLEYRARVFGNHYPFNISGNMLQRQARMTSRRKFYVSLLLSSCLRYVSKSSESKLTSSFEIISRDALRRSLPEIAQVHVFGTSKYGKGRYRGNIWKKIKRLASDLREELNPRVGPESFSKYSTGDRGLDLVAWVPMKDEENCQIVIFGQCACTPKWIEKQHSSSPEKWKNLISFQVKPLNAVFIPFCYRTSDGKWYDAIEISSVMFDRLRLVTILEADLAFDITDLPSSEVVQEAISYRESLF